MLDREVAAEAALDGIYVVRTSLPKSKMSAGEMVRSWWHMRAVWRGLLLADQEVVAKAERDPVAPAKRSAAGAKAATQTLQDETPAHSFRTLLEGLSTIVRNTCPWLRDSPTGTLLRERRHDPSQACNAMR